jgi:hypothetical protein
MAGNGEDTGRVMIGNGRDMWHAMDKCVERPLSYTFEIQFDISTRKHDTNNLSQISNNHHFVPNP